MSKMQKDDLGANKYCLMNNSKTKAFLTILFISLMLGMVISVTLFVNAVIHDINVQNARNTLPSTDLSHVRIEGYILGQYITDWKPKENFSTIICENGERYYRRTSDNISYKDGTGRYVGTETLPPLVFVGDSPIVIINMKYPIIDTSWSPDNGAETWKFVSINGSSVPSFDDAVKALGENYITIRNGRSWLSYSAYIDRQNNLELRFEYTGDDIAFITMMRADNRSFVDFIVNPTALLDDNRQGNRVVNSFYIKMVLYSIEGNFRYKEFLNPISAYFSIPPYFAMWTFPLVWAIYKRSLTPFIIMVIWYPMWYIFGVLSFFAQQ